MIKLRPIEPEDLHFLYELENDRDLWSLSDQQQGFSKKMLLEYIQQADRDIYEAKQLRLAIEKIENGELLGFVDLFDFDPKNRRAGVGIIIKKGEREKGIGYQALMELIDYSFNILFIHQLFAHIEEDNQASIVLFKKAGFVKTGIKKDWVYTGKSFKDVFFYQLINE
jgi:diamine N-acetyltransferase